jgi:prepilin-type N-terminal cleavage/methylation domain-containing protein
MKQTSAGFTVIEIIIVIAIVAASSVLFFVQKDTIESAARDEQRKTAINAIYYSLEEVYFANNDAYPRVVSDEVLPSVDPELFRDPNGVRIGDGASDYRYEATNCEADLCQAYTLRTTLENEDDYVKTQR